MSMRYKQKPVTTGVTRFTASPMADVEFSRMTANPVWMLPFNAGDIIPVYYAEVLPHDTFEVDLDFVIRQMTALHPTMGDMVVDFYAFSVPNRIVNESWKNVQGENTSGFWTAPEVSLAPLYTGSSAVQVPVGSIADYYGFPTQSAIAASVLNQCNDLKFRGYLEIYNNYFRDENYQSPIPYSKLNVYNGFFEPVATSVGLNGVKGTGGFFTIGSIGDSGTTADGSYPKGAVVKSVLGDGASLDGGVTISISPRLTSFSALGKPLKANKLHDFITSALPAPQKGSEVFFGIGDLAPLTAEGDIYNINGIRFQFGNATSNGFPSMNYNVQFFPGFSPVVGGSLALGEQNTDVSASDYALNGTNLYVDLSKSTGISVNDLRIAVATQQVYETLARGGSRYTELIRSFFGVETENPFKDIPTMLGHIRRKLDLYQVAQTSATQPGETPQGELTAFGYTTNGGRLFTHTFLEHGYVHIFAVVRQRNIYSTFLSPDNFRLSTLDFYLPQFANIGEQPIRRAVLHPFDNESMEDVLGYQEAWWEYRYEPDRCVGLFRSGVPESLDVWNYVDNFDSNFRVVDGDWIKSNAEDVLNRTIAVTSLFEPQFKGLFSWKVTKQRPMPTYSVPGIDTI